ncbi:ANTAR domain-containing protein [Amycolatopsis sp.]|uniref:ANTAR domain-containing protein n=1 Tax=Amycolatopsis sp. TaxID=37632 RepID=UPI002CBE9966|nr:ANTAR domain-containing protein [Amycolatopsis sp.]HVV14100.1 ANTAR domain-containing protein [Amycolatopsis sp.]
MSGPGRADITLFRTIQRDAVFQATGSPYLVLDTGLRIRAVNPAYLAVTGRSQRDLLGMHLFDAFPDNPDRPDADGVTNIERSLERVMSRKRRHHMRVQRHDLANADGEFVARYWVPVNSPVRHPGGKLAGVLHHTEDVSALEPFLHGNEPDDPRMSGLLAIAALRERMASAALHEEAANLRQALVARATIEQAKGLLMAWHQCGPDESFLLLRKLSQQNNAKVREVAAKLVEENGQGPH